MRETAGNLSWMQDPGLCFVSAKWSGDTLKPTYKQVFEEQVEIITSLKVIINKRCGTSKLGFLWVNLQVGGPRAMDFKMWPPVTVAAQGTFQKCKFLDPTLDLLDQKLRK